MEDRGEERVEGSGIFGGIDCRGIGPVARQRRPPAKLRTLWAPVRSLACVFPYARRIRYFEEEGYMHFALYSVWAQWQAVHHNLSVQLKTCHIKLFIPERPRPIS